jgi:hypothetical protein
MTRLPSALAGAVILTACTPDPGFIETRQALELLEVVGAEIRGEAALDTSRILSDVPRSFPEDEPIRFFDPPTEIMPVDSIGAVLYRGLVQAGIDGSGDVTIARDCASLFSGAPPDGSPERARARDVCRARGPVDLIIGQPVVDGEREFWVYGWDHDRHFRFEFRSNGRGEFTAKRSENRSNVY